MVESNTTENELTLIKIKVNGVDVVLDPQPAPPYSFSKKEQDIDSGRNLLGIMERNILEHHPHTLSLKFPPMDRAKMKTLLNILDNPELEVTAFDPFLNDMATYTMYHGDLSPELYIFTESYSLYNEFSVELVEY